MTDFFIADLHLGHKGILSFTKDYGFRRKVRHFLERLGFKSKNYMLREFGSIEEHNDFIVKSINSVVGKQDKLYILGDVVFGKENFKYLSLLNGSKYLIAGNHDCYATVEYLKYFNKVFGQIGYKHEIVLSHIPVHEQQIADRFVANVHGHLHGNIIHDPRYICVSCEQVNFIPMSYEQIMLRVKKINKYSIFKSKLINLLLNRY